MKRFWTTALLLAACACSHLTTVAPATVDLSGTWVLDARRSDSPPPMGHRRSEAEENEDRSTSYGGQPPPHFGGPMPLLPMLTATQMTIGQDPQSMGIEYPNQPYRDVKWGEQKRGLFTIDAGWDNQRRLIIVTKSEPMTVHEMYSLNDVGNTLTLEIDLSSKRMGDRHITRIFNRKPVATEPAR
ncbi:MAG TPA: hypothetical protein VL379_11815 [Pseudomonadales bacterium]|jgi:hypothetical protein|nr:hypothetical protein [Pseudomonadales bacterium]